MKAKNKTFLQALAVFLVVVAGSLLFRSVPPRPQTPAGKQAASVAAKHAASLPAAEKDRFNRTVSFTVKPDLKQSTRWMPGTVGDISAWRDSRTGLVWGPALKDVMAPTLRKQEVDQARTACAAQAPAGAWALPMSRELDAAQQGGLANADKDSRQHWLTYTYVGAYPLPLGRVWDPEHGGMTYFVRCVARSEQ